MTPCSTVFRVGTRPSRLAAVQTAQTVERLAGCLPGARFEVVPLATPGDRDRVTDLRTSPADFFTRDLDEAVLAGRVDCAVHSAKDLPDTMPAGLDWCWLPWREDPRDAWVVRPPLTPGTLPPDAIIGVSSARREAYCRRRLPAARLKPVRGDIEARLAQLDRGDFDALLMAGAALLRLGLGARVAEWIPAEALAPPDGQGALALTFRAGDATFGRLRDLFVKAVRFVGAGAGSAENCTLAGVRALREAEVCLHDALLDPALLDYLPPGAERIDVGKRCGAHALPQADICRLLADRARRGLRVVRLKGGDPGIFGRLGEELDALDALGLPYRLVPGVSSLSAATTGTGLLLTRRGVSHGFAVLTPRGEGGVPLPVDAPARAALPMVFFMATSMAESLVAALLRDGLAPGTPAAVVFDAGTDQARIVRAPLEGLAAAVQPHAGASAGLVLVGESFRGDGAASRGALGGRRVLLTCSAALQDKAAQSVEDGGGTAVRRPLIRAELRAEAVEPLAALGAYDWLVVTSPSAVRCLVPLLEAAGADRRRLPRTLASGAETAAELRRAGLRADAVPDESFGADGLLAAARTCLAPGQRVLRVRSDKAGPGLAAQLRAQGAVVDDCVLYANTAVSYARRPEFDDVLFASASAVEAFGALWGQAALEAKTVVAIGRPTAAALAALGRPADVMAREATVHGAIESLALWHVARRLAGQPAAGAPAGDAAEAQQKGPVRWV